jgi:predicted HicB family RNase H-like nuclease
MRKDDVLHIRIEGRLKKQVKRKAKKEDISMAEFVARALRKEVDV